jgi:carbon storage regulator CsrA
MSGDKGTLVLKRKVGEKIVLGDGVIVITTLKNNRLMIECPRNISVHRAEVFEQKKKESRNASMG